jgi:hypothetical protein
MHATSSSPASQSASSRIVLADDHKLTTVALELVRAAGEYQACRGRGRDAGDLVERFGRRFGVDAQLSEALLAGKVAVEIEGDRLVVPSDSKPRVSEHPGSSSPDMAELLCALRHWCDLQSVDFTKALDDSYVLYVHSKYERLVGVEGCTPKT